MYQDKLICTKTPTLADNGTLLLPLALLGVGASVVSQSLSSCLLRVTPVGGLPNDAFLTGSSAYSRKYEDFDKVCNKELRRTI